MHTVPSTAPAILRVDDDPHLVRLLTHVLHTSKLSYHLLAFSAGEAARAACGRQSMLLIITDHCLPGISELHLAHLLKARSPQTTLPVVVSSNIL
jgi:CheY-like chemotaxis protein